MLRRKNKIREENVKCLMACAANSSPPVGLNKNEPCVSPPFFAPVLLGSFVRYKVEGVASGVAPTREGEDREEIDRALSTAGPAVPSLRYVDAW